MIGEQLEWNDGKHRAYTSVRHRHLDDFVGDSFQPFDSGRRW